MIKKISSQLKAYGFNMLIRNLSWEIRMRTMWTLRISFSQDLEDILIDKLLGKKKRGLYVDVGAYDTTRFSNTKKFYLRGWQGINIEPDPIRIDKFYKERQRDINLNFGVANKNGRLDFYKFNPQTLSTFSQKQAQAYQKQGFILTQKVKIKVCKLSYLLERYLGKKSIDFLSIDTEGFDLEVLKSNNWKKFKPKVICIESSEKSIDKLLLDQGYTEVFKNSVNSIYKIK